MTIKAALDGVETALALIIKGDADPAAKIEALRPLLYQLRSDIIDTSEQEYRTYMDAEAAPLTEMQALEFDDASIQQKFYDNFSKQQINNLRSYYDIEAFQEVDNDRLRVCMARALCQFAAESGVAPNKSWSFVINAEGNI